MAMASPLFLFPPQPGLCSSYRFAAAPREANSWPPLRCIFLRRKWVLVPVRDTAAFAGSIPAGEAVETEFQEIRRIEKELAFRPAFADYVKIMESVNLDRSKRPAEAPRDSAREKRSFGARKKSNAISHGRKVGRQKTPVGAARKRENADCPGGSLEGLNGALDNVVEVSRNSVREKGPVGEKRRLAAFTNGKKVGWQNIHFGAANKELNEHANGPNTSLEGLNGSLNDDMEDYGNKASSKAIRKGHLSNTSSLDDDFADGGELLDIQTAGCNENYEILPRAHGGNINSRQTGKKFTIGGNQMDRFSGFGDDDNARPARNAKLRFDKKASQSSSSSKGIYSRESSVSWLDEKREGGVSPPKSLESMNSRRIRSKKGDSGFGVSMKDDGAKPTADMQERHAKHGKLDVQYTPRYIGSQNVYRNNEADRKLMRRSHRTASSTHEYSSARISSGEFEPQCDNPEADRWSRGHCEKFSAGSSNGLNAGTVAAIPRKVYAQSQGDYTELSKLATGDASGIEFEDRAAFKTFEVFNDVRNRPRVLRMEMEESIYKLASRLNASDVNMSEWHFSKMMYGAKIKFSEHTFSRIVQILGKFGNWKRVLQIVEWLQSRERFQSYKSRFIYTSVLNVLGKAKRPQEALNVFYAMQEQLSSYPDLAAYHCIAVTLGQAGLMKELFDVIDCMRSPPKKSFKLGPLQKWDPRVEPDLVVYNAVLNACVQTKQWEGAFWVLQQLKETGIRPANTTYGLVMEVMLACGKYSLVYEFFNKVSKSSIPAALNYKVLINAFWKEGKVDEAVQAVEDMERRGVVGSASLYYDLARCLCSAGRCQEGLRQVQKICRVAKKPLVVTYTGLLQACVDVGSAENAKYIFDEMHKFCSPNVVTCNILLKFFVKCGKLQEALDLFRKILSGVQHVSCRGDVSHKVIPDKFMFNTIIEASATSENWDGFEYAFRQMLHHGFHFDARRHLRAVLEAYRAGKVQVLDDTYNHLIDYDRVPPTQLLIERFCLKLREDDIAAAISSIAKNNVELCRVTAKSWSNILARNAAHLKRETIVQLVHEVRDLVGPRTSRCAYRNILCGCTEFLSQLASSGGPCSIEQRNFPFRSSCQSLETCHLKKCGDGQLINHSCFFGKLAVVMLLVVGMKLDRPSRINGWVFTEMLLQMREINVQKCP